MTRFAFAFLALAGLSGAADTAKVVAKPTGAPPAPEWKPETDMPAQPLVHGPDNHGHALRGTVDSVNTVTVQELAKLGEDSARKLYVGKIVTFRDVVPVGVSAKNERKKNVCMQGFWKSFKPWMGALQGGDQRLLQLRGRNHRMVETPPLQGGRSSGRESVSASRRCLRYGKSLLRRRSRQRTSVHFQFGPSSDRG